MKLIIIGTGCVVHTSALCFANVGHGVICIDKDENKIKSLQIKELVFKPSKSFEERLRETIEFFIKK